MRVLSFSFKDSPDNEKDYIVKKLAFKSLDKDSDLDDIITSFYTFLVSCGYTDAEIMSRIDDWINEDGEKEDDVENYPFLEEWTLNKMVDDPNNLKNFLSDIQNPDNKELQKTVYKLYLQSTQGITSDSDDYDESEDY